MKVARQLKRLRTRRAIAVASSRCVIEFIHFLDRQHVGALEDELGDAIAWLDLERAVQIGIEQQHLHLASVIMVDYARHVDADLERQAAAPGYPAVVARWDRHCYA